jgi:adenosylcobinamide-GDP ribazoletransferase
MGFLTALEFLTRLRVRRTPLGDLRSVADAQAWFPLVGLVIGALLVAVDWLARRALPDASAAVLVVVALVAITGALHLDGLADAADGLLSGRDREERLRIMHDVHAGSYAIVAIVCVLAMKWAGIAALPSGAHYEALLLAPCLARFAMLLASATAPYARPGGAGAAFHARAWPVATTAGAATALAASIVLFGAGGVAIVAFAAACGVAAGAIGRRFVGGMTGDLFGATIEVSEALLLLAIAALAQRGWAHGWLLA